MAQAVNVQLIRQDGSSFDVNTQGLAKVDFDRFIQRDYNTTNSFLSKMELSMFDATGYKLLKELQEQSGKIQFRYGFDNNMSDTYSLTALKINTQYSNLGTLITIGAVGQQVVSKWGAQFFRAGARIKDIILELSSRNGWYTGTLSDKEKYVDIPDSLLLSKDLVKTPNELDIDFIYNKILPIANSSVAVLTTAIENINFWEVKLVPNNARIEFYFRPYSNKKQARRIWYYSYGDTTDSQIIDLTNKVDFSFVINGINVQVPMTPEFLVGVNQDDLSYNLKTEMAKEFDKVKEIISSMGIPLLNVDEFKFNVEIVDSENVGNKTPKDIILERLKDIMQTLNTIEMTIVGNPQIKPTDMIKLKVVNADGNPTIISSSGDSYWRIVGISESIGLNGYQTRLKLVRETLTK